MDLNADVPISFAALNVVKRAETQAFVGPEMSLNQRDLVYVAKPITHQGVVVGVLFVALSRDYFFDPLRSYDNLQGRVRIEQVFAGWESVTGFLVRDRAEYIKVSGSIIEEGAYLLNAHTFGALVPEQQHSGGRWLYPTKVHFLVRREIERTHTPGGQSWIPWRCA